MKSSEEKRAPARAEVFKVECEGGCPPHRSVEPCSILVDKARAEVLRYVTEVEVLPEQDQVYVALAEGAIASSLLPAEDG